MKTKTFALCALFVAFVACNKNGEDAPINNNFVKGQKVVLTVSAPSYDDTQSAPVRMAYGHWTSTELEFRWSATDDIEVYVGSAHSTFTIVNFVEGQSSLQFEGTMPADGSTFDVVCGPNNVSTEQINVAGEDIKNGYMRFEAKNVSISSSSLTLSPVWPAIILNAAISSEFEDDIHVTADTYRKSAIEKVEVLVEEQGKSAVTYTYKAESGNLTAGSDQNSDPVKRCIIVVAPITKGDVTVTTYWKGDKFIAYEDEDREIVLEPTNKVIAPTEVKYSFPITKGGTSYNLDKPNAFNIAPQALAVKWKKKS